MGFVRSAIFNSKQRKQSLNDWGVELPIETVVRKVMHCSLRKIAMRTLQPMVAAVLFCFAESCEHPALFRFSDFSVEFELVNAIGQATETFAVGEDVRFSYSVTSLASGPVAYTIPDTGPIVTFEILRQDSLIGTSDDGVAYALVIVEGGLNAGETIRWEYNWYSVEQHEPLPAGDYVARAQPRLIPEEGSLPSAQTLPFRIASTSDVVITDQSPASLQLDAFQLDSVEVAGDSISMNVSHSGGCSEHEYTLFMSPAAFLESFPVQANLFLRHDDNDDPCDGLFTSRISFNLQPVADLYHQSYGGKDEIILNLFHYFGTDPGGHLSMSYTPQ